MSSSTILDFSRLMRWLQVSGMGRTRHFREFGEVAAVVQARDDIPGTRKRRLGFPASSVTVGDNAVGVDSVRFGKSFQRSRRVRESSIIIHCWAIDYNKIQRVATFLEDGSLEMSYLTKSDNPTTADIGAQVWMVEPAEDSYNSPSIGGGVSLKNGDRHR